MYEQVFRENSTRAANFTGRVKGPTRHHPDLDRRSAPFVLIILPTLTLDTFSTLFQSYSFEEEDKVWGSTLLTAVPTLSSFVFA